MHAFKFHVGFRRSSSDVMVFRQTRDPCAQEMQEKLRHSMQSSCGIRRAGTGQGGGNMYASTVSSKAALQSNFNQQKAESPAALASPQTKARVVSSAMRSPAAHTAAASNKLTSPATNRQLRPSPQSSNRLPPGLAPMPSSSQPHDETESHADWWQRPGSRSESVISYPMTAVSRLFRVHMSTSLTRLESPCCIVSQAT